MRNAISFGTIRDVRLGVTDSAVVSGVGTNGIESETTFRLADIPSVAVPLLCCAAAGAATPPPLPGTIIPGCHLPVMQWETGRSPVNGEPLLRLIVSGGSVLTFQFPSQAAQQCGQALMNEGALASPAPGTRLS